jgi:hypothetical protein
MVLVEDTSAELDCAGVIDVDPVVVLADGAERSPDAKVVSHRELHRRRLVRHAVRVEANDLTRGGHARARPPVKSSPLSGTPTGTSACLPRTACSRSRDGRSIVGGADVSRTIPFVFRRPAIGSLLRGYRSGPQRPVPDDGNAPKGLASSAERPAIPSATQRSPDRGWRRDRFAYEGSRPQPTGPDECKGDQGGARRVGPASPGCGRY